MRPLRILAISGSLRAASTNWALLSGLAAMAEPPLVITLSDHLRHLPVFSPDDEGAATPPAVRDLIAAIAAADGVLISSPEYIRDIPGGLKNAIDWLVSGEQAIAKPIWLAHASHRGDDALDSLRRILATLSVRFAPDIFLRLPLMKKTPDQIATALAEPENHALCRAFLDQIRDDLMTGDPAG